MINVPNGTFSPYGRDSNEAFRIRDRASNGTVTWKPRHNPWVIALTVTLATFLVPNFILVTRISVLETMREQFVTTARARGASASRALWGHVLPNAINPVVSLVGLQLGRLMGGAVITESIFAWPGVGRLMVSGIFQRDVPIVIASVFIVAVTIVLANLLVDLVQAAIDPRIRLR